MTTGQDIVTYARSWKGARWRHQGRGKGADRGIDCAGLLLVTAQHFGLPNGDMQGYRRNPSRAFVENVNRWTIPTTTVVNGAIGIFHDTLQPCHCGIFAIDPESGEVTVIHSEAAPAGRCHEEGYADSTPSLKDRLVSIRLFKDVEYG